MQTIQQAYQRAVELSNEAFEAEDWHGAEIWHNVAAAIDLAVQPRPQHQLHEQREPEPCGA